MKPNNLKKNYTKTLNHELNKEIKRQHNMPKPFESVFPLMFDAHLIIYTNFT